MDDLKQYVKNVSAQLAHGRTEPDFFEIVRRFEQLNPALPRLGCGKSPAEDVLRFGQEPYLCFPENSVASIHESNHNAAALLIVYFFGLCGVNGPMPLEFTSIVFQRSHNHYDLTLQRFLDIINHRFLTFFYRAWAANEAAVSFDRRGDDPIGTMLRGLSGCAPDFKEGLWRDADFARIATSAYFSTGCHSRDGLEQLLSEYLREPVTVQDRVPGTYPIPAQFRCKLGREKTSLLGVNMQLGHHFISITKKFDIHFGPLDFSHYLNLLPGTPGFLHLCTLTAMYVDQSFSFDFVFHIRRDTVPVARLNGTVALGRSVWLGPAEEQTIRIHIEASQFFSDEHRRKQRSAYQNGSQPERKAG